MKRKMYFIYLSLLISLVIFFFLSFLFYQRLASLMRYSNEVETKYKIIYKIEQIASYLEDIESGQRGYIITKDSNFLKSSLANTNAISFLTDSIRMLVADKKNNRNLILLQRHAAERIKQLDISLGAAASGDSSALFASMRTGRRLMDLCRTDIENMQGEQMQLLNERFNKKKFYERITPNYLAVLLFFAGGFMLVSFYLLIKEFKHRTQAQYQLEKQVKELDRSNAELEQLTFVASHDLQEPLRKIRTFTDWLLYKNSGKLDDETKLTIQRIENSARRMSGFLIDIVKYTNLLHSNENLTQINLNEVVQQVQKELSESIAQKNAVIQIGPLLMVTGYSNQLHSLFRAIIENALKFSRPDVSPVIKIRYLPAQDEKQNYQAPEDNRVYYKIVVEDNGVGFDNEFCEKIFVMFQRLHDTESDYQGKGIGLAIVQRVMINHGGFAIADGKAGEGASFHLYFPAGLMV